MNARIGGAAVVTMAAALAGSALGQSAEIEVSVPSFAFGGGDPIHVSLVVRWNGGVALASVRGSLVVTPAIATGSVENFESDLTASALVNLGTFDGLSRVGIDANSVPPFFVGGVVSPPWGNNTGVTVVEYDIRTFEPGFYYARWVPDTPDQRSQGVRIYANTAGPALLDPAVANISTWFFVGCCPGPICGPDLTNTANPAHGHYGVRGGALNNEDFFFYLARFAVGDRGVCDMTSSAIPGTPGYGFPNGVLNNDDFFYYLDQFAQGC